MKKRYALFTLLVLGGYGTAGWRGWEMFAAEKDRIPQNIRQAPGGYRSFTYWRGGK
jgi:hypothetical protein